MNGSIILISTLVIIWWIAVWGLIDIFLKDILGNSKKSYIMVYSAKYMNLLMMQLIQLANIFVY